MTNRVIRLVKCEACGQRLAKEDAGFDLEFEAYYCDLGRPDDCWTKHVNDKHCIERIDDDHTSRERGRILGT